MPQPVVFFDIAGPDDAEPGSFYASVFEWEMDQSGQFGVPVVTPIKGAIRKDPTEQPVYIRVPDVSASLSLIEQSGGTVDVPRFEVPGVVVDGLFRDPAGNPMGLIEMDGDSPRIP
jgi:hypothetical protein